MILKAKGTYDLYGEDSRYVEMIKEEVKKVMDVNNYHFIRTPLFESSDLFHRSAGDSSDIVTKETYDFKDRSGRDLTLRPEGTAGVVRSFIENKMNNNLVQPVKLYYFGPMYRYERPQAGRFREFYQFGMEVFGDESAYTDAELLATVIQLFKNLNIEKLRLRINSLGDEKSRMKYKKILVNYFENHKEHLCKDCLRRLETNPLRILDCKVDKDKKIFEDAPKIHDFLTKDSIKYFEKVEELLESLNINYVVDKNLVRGLDYYDELVFEIDAEVPELGANNVICAGGRYNRLVKFLEGDNTKAVGLAVGIERLVETIKKVNKLDEIRNDLYILAVSETERDYAIKLAVDLRAKGYRVEYDPLDRNLKPQFKQSDHLKSKYMIILNDELLEKGEVDFKDVDKQKKTKIKLKDLEKHLK